MIFALLVAALQVAHPATTSIPRAVFPGPTPVFMTPEGKHTPATLEVLARLSVSPDDQIVVVAAREPTESVYDPDRGVEVRLAGVHRTTSGWTSVWVRDLSAELPVQTGDSTNAVPQCAEVSAVLKLLPEPRLFLLALRSRLSGQGRISRTDLTVRTVGGDAPGFELLKVPAFTEHGRAMFDYSKGGEVRWRNGSPGSATLLHITGVEQLIRGEDIRPVHRSTRTFQWSEDRFTDLGSLPGVPLGTQPPVLALENSMLATATPNLDRECESLRAFASGVSADGGADPVHVRGLARNTDRLRGQTEEPPCGRTETLELRKLLLTAQWSHEADVMRRNIVASEIREVADQIAFQEGSFPGTKIEAARISEPREAVRRLLGLMDEYPRDEEAAFVLCLGAFGIQPTRSSLPPDLVPTTLQGCLKGAARLQASTYPGDLKIVPAVGRRFRELGCNTTEPEPTRTSLTAEGSKAYKAASAWLASFRCPASPTKEKPVGR